MVVQQQAYVGTANNSTVEECENVGSIEGNYVGGIVACPTWGTKILKCVNRGTITAKNSKINKGGFLGGICAYANALGGKNQITSCYNRGTLIGIQDTKVGGITGVGPISGTKECMITNCYNAGIMQGSHFAAGILGYPAEATGTFASCFWREGCGTSVGIGGGKTVPGIVNVNDTKLKSEEMISLLGSDFEQGEDGYPVLIWEKQ